MLLVQPVWARWQNRIQPLQIGRMHVICMVGLLFISVASLAQNQPGSGQKTGTQRPDTNQVNELNRLARIYQWKAPEKSKDYAREAYLLATRINYAKGASYALWKLGSLHELQGNYNKALYYFLESIRVHPPQENTTAKAHAFGSIANLYTSLGQYKQAETYLTESFSIFKNLSHPLGIAISHRRLGFLHFNQNQLQQGMQHFLRSLTLMQELQDTVGIGYARASMGQVYFQEKKYTQALEEYTQAVTLQEKTENFAEKAYLLIYIGKIYTQTGEYAKAIESCTQALTLAKELNFKPALQESYKSLAAIYKAQGNLKQALYCYDQFLVLHNELLSDETMENIADLQIQYQTFEKEQEIELLKKEKEIQSLKITESTHIVYFFAAILLLLLVVCGLLYSRITLKKKANLILRTQNEAIGYQKNKIEQQNKLLKEANKVIEDQNQLLELDKIELEEKVKEKTMALMEAYTHLLQATEEMDILVYKSSHDLRGPLATILGLCNIAFIDVKEKTALTYFNLLAKNATRMDALLHRLLKVNHVKHAEIHSTLLQPTQLISDAIAAVATTDGYAAMQFYIESEPELNLYSDPDLVKTVLENLLQNSIHYRSLTVDNPPSVWLKAERYGNAVRFMISDNGIGIEKEYVSKLFTLFSKVSSRSQGSGLGLYIAKAAVSRVQGSIRYCSELTEATTFEVIIPNLNNKPVFHPLPMKKEISIYNS
ncbi:tetratricopeptide repeat protein [Rhodocytophaga aerolata]|uniref:histidine kinase n=1 Tax=Rhodocytophaga aerolata TaxID=455078 RepID=A0ABT8QYR3_9BACT|nr:tetratricopeptide repeat protein [Rhodocytophaga aerolata]MDO1444978.1 tetratricopeptide repeat protein [Rhodocytophaga aerolata]